MVINWHHTAHLKPTKVLVVPVLAFHSFKSTTTIDKQQVLLRGCRCIEIDVWNGEPASFRGRSKSPHSQCSQDPSRTSETNVALAALESVDKFARQYLGDKPSMHSRTPSAQSRHMADGMSPRTSTLDLPGTSRPVCGRPDSAASLDVGYRQRSRRNSSPPRGEPIVTHGHTLTIPCGFREVCEAIKDSAFANNHLPIIISLEVHADWEQQEVMVQIMKEVWQDLLLTESIENFDPRFRVPTLGDLQRKILVKVKKGPVGMPPLQAEQGVGAGIVHLTTYESAQHNSDHFLTRSVKSVSQSAPNLPARAPLDDQSLSSETDLQPRRSCVAAPPLVTATASQDRVSIAGPICESLGSLAVYTCSEHFKTFQTTAAKKPAHIFSISEKRILELYQKSRRDVFLHNKNYFMRVYPDKMRVTSSNLDPSLSWRRGVQMAAMNWQHVDTGMMLNEGMFSDEQGWVLKPPGYQSSDKTAESHDEAAAGFTLDLSIIVFAGHNIPTQSDDFMEYPRSGSTIRPYVKVDLHVDRSEVANGKEADAHTYKKQTEAGKTSHPSFGQSPQPLTFKGVPKVVPELSFVR